MNSNNDQQTREERYKHYRRSIDAENEQANDGSLEQPTNQQNNRYQAPKKKSKHIGRWIALCLGLLLVIGIFTVAHDVSELSDTQRQHDTLLDKAIKTQAEQIAKEKAPAQVKTQVIKIIQEVPLSELQRAANDQALFNQIATKYQVPQVYTTVAQKEWFTPSTQNTRTAIQNGDAIKALSALKSNSTTSSN